MNCQEGMELMQRYVDYDLNDEETARLMEHIGQCPDCAAMFQRLVNLSRGLEQLPRVTPPYSLVDAILPQLDRIQPEPGAGVSAMQPEGAREDRMPRRRRAERRHYRSWMASVTAVAALGAVIGLLILNRPDAGPLTFNRQVASMSELAGSAGQAAMETSSADALLFATPTAGAGASDGDAAEQPGTPPDGIMQGFGGLQNPEQDSVEQPLAKDKLNGEDQYGGALTAPSPANPPQAPESAPVPSLGAGMGEQAPLPENPPAEEVPEELFGEGLMMSIMDFPAVSEEAISPDGQWNAVIVDGALQLYRMSDNALVYDQAPDPCMRSGLVWSEDGSEVRYVCTDPDGKEIPMALRIEEQTFTEIRR